MLRIIVNMQNYLMCQAIEVALKQNGNFYTITVEQPMEIIEKCSLLAPDILLMEVTGYTPWKLEERLAIRDEVKKTEPNCKIVFLVDENTEKEVAQQIKQAKRDGVIDQFIYGSTSASFLAALMETV